MFGGKCEKLDKPPSSGCLPTFVILVNPYGDGICGCPFQNEFDEKHQICIETEAPLRTVFSLPKLCPDGQFLDQHLQCQHLTRGLPYLDAQSKREMLAMSMKSLRRFLLNRRTALRAKATTNDPRG
jgi:hypothetical protein